MILSFKRKELKMRDKIKSGGMYEIFGWLGLKSNDMYLDFATQFQESCELLNYYQKKHPGLNVGVKWIMKYKKGNWLK